jgi:hypothetical protein
MPNPLKPLDDVFETREREFVKAQGISELDYTQLLEEATLHAAATPSVAGAPSWRFVGPRNIGGRIIALAQDPVDPRIIYAGSAHGGLWRSIDAGDTWERLGAADHVFPVGTIAVAPTAPNVLYFGTGALDPSYVSGRGIWRATISGTTGAATIERLKAPDNPTVAPVNATAGASLRYTRIRVDPHDPTRFWAASQSGLWRCECPLASPVAPVFTRDFPDSNNLPAAAALAATLNSQGLWPAHCTDLLVAADPRETDTADVNGVAVPRYLILHVAIDGVGIFRGRFDRSDRTVSFENAKLVIAQEPTDFSRIRLAQCERHPQNIAAIFAIDRGAVAGPNGSLLQQAVDGLGNPIALQYTATPGSAGESPGFTTLLRAGDRVTVSNAGVTEDQTVNAVVNDTDFTVLTAYATAFPAPGIFYFRTAVPDHNNSTEVYRSSNNGDQWTKGLQRMATVGGLVGQADYDLVLEIAPDDPSIVICGEGDFCFSRDGGNTLTKILDWLSYDRGDKAQHADQHIAMFDRGDHRRIWVGNDGGLSMARDLRLPTQANGYWRKRSHGIYAGQCQDVSVSPTMPFMCASGFQDNGTFLSLGGPTWYHVGGADGGAIAFHLTSPRQLFVTWQGLPSGEGIEQVDAVASDSPLGANPGAWYDLVSNAAGDLPESVARGHQVRYRWTPLSIIPGSGITRRPLFVGVLEQHPATAGNFLAGRRGDAYWSQNFGAAWAPLMGVGLPLGGEVSALAFGPVDARNPVAGAVDGWAGNSFGQLFFTTNAPAAGWGPATSQLPFPGPALRISEIVPHPFDRRIVVVSATGVQGRVFMTYNQGRTWIDITEPTPTALAVTPAGASIGLTQTRGFTASATYTGGAVIDVTARANWSSSSVILATVGTAQTVRVGNISGFGTEGHVTGVAAGVPNITATLIAGVPTATATQAVTITGGAQPAVALAAPPRTIVPGSMPPGPASSVIFDPSVPLATATTVFVGTLAGVYALPGVPVVQSLAIQPGPPPATLVFQNGPATFQLRCVATFTDGTQVDVTRDVDWSSSTGNVTVSNAPGSEGQLTFNSNGPAVISANRGGVPAATRNVTVQGGAAPAPPALPAPPPAANPPITVNWQRFNAGLPQVLVTDFERVAGTNAIRAATFGLGVFECVTAGGPLQQLHIRQTIIEDGRRYPRTNPPAIADDPRLPTGRVNLDMTHAFDIRLDAPPYVFFDDVVDGVELDEQLEVADAIPTEENYVYVQVHNTGASDIGNVTVHLYAAVLAAGDAVNAIGSGATVFPASLEVAGAAPIADFYGQTNRDPIPASLWKRIDTARVLDTVASDAPRVARFTWVPDLALENKNVALLALCEGPPLSNDPLPAAPAGVTLSAFILAERRAALRVVHVAFKPTASLYVRDGIADDTRLGGYPVGGRSPDIMVVHPDITTPVATAFANTVARRVDDTISGSATNFIYVRVHNRRRFRTNAKVKVFAIRLNDANAPTTDTSLWTELPAGAGFGDVAVDPLSVGYAKIEFPTATDPNTTGTNKTYLLLALVKSEDDVDPLPNKDRVDTVDAFWELVARYMDSDNAAARAVRWVP